MKQPLSRHMSLSIEAWRATTELNKRRILIRFCMRPDASIIAMLKEVNARYRKTVGAARPAWYLPEDNVQSLFDELSRTTQTPGGQVEQLLDALRPFITEEDDDIVVPPPAKRLRPLPRLGRECRACTYESRMIAEGSLGFGQLFHTCEC